MTMDEWRTFLYPLGFISAILFGARFIIQWVESEKAKNCVVPRTFWQLSLAGNLSLLVHSFIQFQFHISLVQGCNAVISWRNLKLMEANKPHASTAAVCGLLIGAALLIALSFAAQEFWLTGDGNWFRIPQAPWQTTVHSTFSGSASFGWHAIGTLAYLMFSSRFWIQWWMAEKTQESQLSPSFWWLSLIGAVLSIAYFLRIGDSVNLIGPLFGIVPYLRNLMLGSKKRKETAGVP